MNILRSSVVLSVLFLFSTAAFADIYKYVGEDGVILYTDAPFGKKTERVIREKKSKEDVTCGETKNITDTAKHGDTYHHIVNKKAKEHEVDPLLVKAVIKAESNWDRRAVSRKGAMGLMQLMPVTAYELQVKNPFDAEENIDGGIRYLRSLLDKFSGDLSLALAAYNAGPKTVEKYGAVPPISETKNYVKKVLSLYNGKSDNGSYKAPKPEPIYKIIMEDGTILFTNFPLKSNSIRF